MIRGSAMDHVIRGAKTRTRIGLCMTGWPAIRGSKRKEQNVPDHFLSGWRFASRKRVPHWGRTLQFLWDCMFRGRFLSVSGRCPSLPVVWAVRSGL